MEHFIGAKARIKGALKEVQRTALVDTGAFFSLLDEELADEIGVKYFRGEKRKITIRGLCCEVEGELAGVEELYIEGRLIGSTSMVVLKFPSYLKEALRGYRFAEDLIIGIRDIPGFVLDVERIKLKYVRYMAVKS